MMFFFLFFFTKNHNSWKLWISNSSCFVICVKFFYRLHSIIIYFTKMRIKEWVKLQYSKSIPTYIYSKDHCVQNSEGSATLELNLPHWNHPVYRRKTMTFKNQIVCKSSLYHNDLKRNRIPCNNHASCKIKGKFFKYRNLIIFQAIIVHQT
jgi:hypothetical protein